MESLETVDSELYRLSGLRFQPLRLRGDLEASFEDMTRPERCRRLWLEGLFAIVIFNLVLLAGQFSHPSFYISILIAKLYWITPFALLVNFLMLRKPSVRVRESSIAVLTIALGLAALAIELHRGEIDALLAQFGLSIVLIFSHCVMRLRFSYALAVSSALGCGEVLFATYDEGQSLSVRVLGVCLTFGVLVFTAIANYSHNRQERVGFLLCLRGDLLIAQLHRDNDRLALAAEQDALTGLANRRAFDRRMQEAWLEAVNQGLLLAIIIIDIDHFKRLNDSCGHLFGDKVLRRVGRLLHESLRKKADFAARFGGEEFVILLPGTTMECALAVAERLRNLVQMAGLPALEDETLYKSLETATVSCGVAAGSPLQFEGLQHFLGCADRALYRAKAMGRNRTCSIAGAEFDRLTLETILAEPNAVQGIGS